MVMDGIFTYDGQQIEYKIEDDSNCTLKTVKGIEKLARWMNFYLNKEHCGVIRIYDDADILCNITPDYALEQFKKMKSNEK